mmetsp:Transcript_33748/g.37308  ORF Transcript_33748/g.37308 Transcript_33748/m.37308 type:complete len:267 (+) Transcript_33748:1-801(+)
MTEYRSEEIIAATRYMMELNRTNIPELRGVNFVGKLDLEDIHYMGHSFGGASVLYAALKNSANNNNDSSFKIRSIVTHDVMADWIPDSTRLSLFDGERLKDSKTNHTYWTKTMTTTMSDSHHKGRGKQSSSFHPSSSIHNFDLFLLFSHQWESNNWGGVEVLQDMYKRNVFGRQRRIGKNNDNDGQQQQLSLSRVEVVDSAHHIEFSDLCMITPTWLARMVNLTGAESPLKTAKDIHTRTLNFLMEVRGQERTSAILSNNNNHQTK